MRDAVLIPIVLLLTIGFLLLADKIGLLYQGSCAQNGFWLW